MIAHQALSALKTAVVAVRTSEGTASQKHHHRSFPRPVHCGERDDSAEINLHFAFDIALPPSFLCRVYPLQGLSLARSLLYFLPDERSDEISTLIGAP